MSASVSTSCVHHISISLSVTTHRVSALTSGTQCNASTVTTCSVALRIACEACALQHNTALARNASAYSLMRPLNWQSQRVSTRERERRHRLNVHNVFLYRPSDKRSAGKDPALQYAFENQVLNVSCNSHCLSELAPFFIDLRAE